MTVIVDVCVPVKIAGPPSTLKRQLSTSSNGLLHGERERPERYCGDSQPAQLTCRHCQTSCANGC
jgi:hypothetical protein